MTECASVDLAKLPSSTLTTSTVYVALSTSCGRGAIRLLCDFNEKPNGTLQTRNYLRNYAKRAQDWLRWKTKRCDVMMQANLVSYLHHLSDVIAKLNTISASPTGSLPLYGNRQTVLSPNYYKHTSVITTRWRNSRMYYRYILIETRVEFHTTCRRVHTSNIYGALSLFPVMVARYHSPFDHLQGIIVPSGRCVHELVLILPGCSFGYWLMGSHWLS